MFDRFALSDLQAWWGGKNRKPLVLRGARQVGKTSLVRRFAELVGLRLIELNFERRPADASLFEGNDPALTLQALELQVGETLDPRKTLLFLDEIQAAPELLAKLRWFYEDMPEWPVIAAGSLLEFVLTDHEFSMPVGRIAYCHLEPLTFKEFLSVQDGGKLIEYIESYSLGETIPTAIHQKLMAEFKTYVLVGGLPEAVNVWIQDQSWLSVAQVHHQLLATYRDDYSRYNGRLAIGRLDEVLNAVPKMLGDKFKYSRVNPDVKSQGVKQALLLLEKARLCHVVQSTHANGVPLAAEVNAKQFKVIFADMGLVGSMLQLDLIQFQQAPDMTLVNAGQFAEQIVGQVLRTLNPDYVEPHLYYWARESRNSNAEVDYVITHRGKVVPVEVKAGETGTLRSLHVFVAEKQVNKAVRINADIPSVLSVDTMTPLKKPARYQLLSIPFYLATELERLLNQL